MTQILHKELSYELNGVLFTVHNKLGKFVSEKQVCDEIEQELSVRKIYYQREYEIGETIRHKVDFFIEDKIILEVKCKKYLLKEDYYQVQRYLHAANLALGVLVNFRDDRINPKRILNSSGNGQ